MALTTRRKKSTASGASRLAQEEVGVGNFVAKKRDAWKNHGSIVFNKESRASLLLFPTPNDDRLLDGNPPFIDDGDNLLYRMVLGNFCREICNHRRDLSLPLCSLD